MKDAIYSKNDRHDTDWVFTNGVQGRDVDPEVQILVRRCTMLRRAAVKQPGIRDKLKRIYSAYCEEAKRDERAKWYKQAIDGEDPWEPWRHSCSAQRIPVVGATHPRGPIGLLIEEMVRIDARIDDDFTITVPHEQPIPLMSIPVQYL